jgi:hypothetical protein
MKMIIIATCALTLVRLLHVSPGRALKIYISSVFFSVLSNVEFTVCKERLDSGIKTTNDKKRRLRAI